MLTGQFFWHLCLELSKLREILLEMDCKRNIIKIIDLKYINYNT